MKKKMLHLKHRPKTLKDIIGQDTAIKILKTAIKKKKIPHALLFTGPTGCGKTTLGRIMVRKLKCSKLDFVEINTADFRGIEMIRGIRVQTNLSLMDPRRGKSKCWLIDEAHQLSSQAQHAFLKLLEEPPDWVYFILCTTEPQKLLSTIRSRCATVALTLLADKDLRRLINKVCLAEKSEISNGVTNKIIEHSEGSARQALVYLGTVVDLNNKKDQLAAIEPPETKEQAIKIARELLNPKKTSWEKIISIVKNVKLDEEQLRWMILTYANSVIEGGGPLMGKAFLMIDAFSEPFYDSGRAGFNAACYRVLFGEG